MDNILLHGENLVKEYGTVEKTRALNEVNITLRESEFSSIIGASGCGKSTLLNLLGALDQPTSGKLYFRDKEFTSMKEDELAQFRNKRIGFIFQFHHLLPEFTALENVMIPTWIESGVVSQKKEKRAIELLETVGLKDKIRNPSNILADNGMEFLNPSLIEASNYGGPRTRLYYCDPLSPGQKGGIEKNHVELRKVLPKGTSFDSLPQEKLLLAVNHINSYSRVSLNGKTAFDIAALLFNKSFFEKMGLAKVHPDEVCLTPALLK